MLRINPSKYLKISSNKFDFIYNRNKVIFLYISSLILRIGVYKITGFKAGGEQTDASAQLGIFENLMHVTSGFSVLFVYLIIVYAVTQRRNNIITMVCITEIVYYILFTHSKSGPFLFLFIVASLLVTYNILSRKRLVIGVFVLLLTFPFYYHVKSLERFSEVTGDRISIKESSKVVNEIGFRQLLNPIVDRLDVVSTFAKTVEHYKLHEYDTGFYFGQLYNTYVPRILDQKKGYSSSHGIFVSKEILGIKKYHTHAAVTPFIEGWLFLGFFGFCLVISNYTIVIVILEYTMQRFSNPLLRLSIFASSLLNIINVSNVQTLPKYLIIQSIILIPAVRWVTVSKSTINKV